MPNCRGIERLLVTKDFKHNIFSFEQAPIYNLKWQQRAGGAPTLDYTGCPVIFRMVGSVESITIPTEGDDQGTYLITMKFMREIDYMWKALLTEEMTRMRCSTLMSPFTAQLTKNTLVSFEHAYTAHLTDSN